MLKGKNKFKSAISMVMVLALSFACVTTSAFAATTASQNKSITSSTIVTDDNAYDVLEYLRIDKGNIIKTDFGTSEQSNVTVGELKQAIDKAKNLPKNLNRDFRGHNKNAKTQSSLLKSASTGTVMLYYDLNCDGYIVSYEVAGNYSGNKWTGASSASVSVDGNGDTGPISYKIGSKNLRLSYTSSLIKLNAKVVVDTYAGVGPLTVKIGSQNVTTMATWDTSYIN